MEERTLKALKESIAHYEAQQRGEEPGLGIRYCALCRMFNANMCGGCPVKKHNSGAHGCLNTPYEAWGKHCFECQECGDNHNQSNVLPRCPKGKRLHKEELDFLRFLLPKE